MNMRETKDRIINVGLRLGFGLMRIPGAAVCGVWKIIVKTLIVVLDTTLETVGVISEILKTMI